MLLWSFKPFLWIHFHILVNKMCTKLGLEIRFGKATEIWPSNQILER